MNESQKKMKRMKPQRTAILLMAASFLITGCEEDVPTIPTPVPNTPGDVLIPDLEPAEPVTGRLELPERDPDLLFLQHKTLVGEDSVETFSIEYDYGLFHAVWVAYRFDSTTRQRNVTRSADAFKDDPLLPMEYRIGSASFREDGDYDRGHLCASADRLYSEEANRQTFYMSNMSPQIASFNQRYWKLLEEQVQEWGRSEALSDTLYVCKGAKLSGESVLGYVRKGLMPIPSHYYMALLAVKDGTYHSLAFLVEHKAYQGATREEVIERHHLSVRELERATGINFFAALPESVAETVETEDSLWIQP